jgi:hypothetical protein
VEPKELKKRFRTYDVLPWLKKETSYIAQINEALQMEEHVPADQRTRDGTGSCGICFRNIKIDGGRMALHGYNRPGVGHVIGECGGRHFPAYELSSVGTAHVLKQTREYIAGLKKTLQHMAHPSFKEMVVPDGYKKIRIIHKDDPHWDAYYKSKVDELQGKIKRAEGEADVYAWLVKDWKVRPLPKQGDKEVDWYSNAARAVSNQK